MKRLLAIALWHFLQPVLAWMSAQLPPPPKPVLPPPPERLPRYIHVRPVVLGPEHVERARLMARLAATDNALTGLGWRAPWEGN